MYEILQAIRNLEQLLGERVELVLSSDEDTDVGRVYVIDGGECWYEGDEIFSFQITPAGNDFQKSYQEFVAAYEPGRDEDEQ